MTLLVGYLTRKIVSEMTYNVSSGTLNTTIPYHTIPAERSLIFKSRPWNKAHSISFFGCDVDKNPDAETFLHIVVSFPEVSLCSFWPF